MQMGVGFYFPCLVLLDEGHSTQGAGGGPPHGAPNGDGPTPPRDLFGAGGGPTSLGAEGRPVNYHYLT